MMTLLLIYRVLKDANSKALIHIVKQAYRETKGTNSIKVFWCSFKVLLLLAEGMHDTVRILSKKMCIKHPIGFYYLAQSEFLCGEYWRAKNSLIKFLSHNKSHADAMFLLIDCYKELDSVEKAWLLLDDFCLSSKRLKIWSVAANLVTTAAECKKVMDLHEKAVELKLINFYQLDVNYYLAIAFFRANLGDKASLLWKSLHQKNLQGEIRQEDAFKKQLGNVFSEKYASRALFDIQKLLTLLNIEMFLISGTLLGCIRENKLLKHDKDIDVGVWSDVNVKKVLSFVKRSGLFYVRPSRAVDLIKLRHVNGVSIDLFIHHRENDDFWHSGVKQKWHNRPFSLIERDFLGGSYLIPENYSFYLTENYGDWMTPKTKFDSTYDTPNAEIIDENEMLVYNYKKSIEESFK